MKKYYFAYIMASKKNGTLYTGMTNNLMRRVLEHKTKMKKGFTSKYDVNRLVYFEQTDEVEYAIRREKQIKGWLRRKKIALIESLNPEWNDLSSDWYMDSSSLRSGTQNDTILKQTI